MSFLDKYPSSANQPSDGGYVTPLEGVYGTEGHAIQPFLDDEGRLTVTSRHPSSGGSLTRRYNSEHVLEQGNGDFYRGVAEIVHTEATRPKPQFPGNLSSQV